MPDKSSAEQKAALRQYPARVQFFMLVLNLWPLLHLTLLGCAWLAPAGLPGKAAALLCTLYILPPLLARLVQALFRRPAGTLTPQEPGFLVWWLLTQLQTIYLRIGLIEEALRLIPGAYSLWLRSWGSRIGRFTYWGPGTVVLDRGYLDIGDNVVFGASVRLNPHVLAADNSGRPLLTLETIRVETSAQVGGYSLLTAGSSIAAGERPRALLVLPPYSRFERGRRCRANHAG